MFVRAVAALKQLPAADKNGFNCLDSSVGRIFAISADVVQKEVILCLIAYGSVASGT